MAGKAILAALKPKEFDGNEGIIHASIKKLRDKLPEPLIKTVKGVGCRLEDFGGEG